MRSNHGGDIYRNRVKYDFSVNVNPYGMPERCKEAVIGSLRMASCYPDCEMKELREAISKKELGEGAFSGQVITGNGASELIYALCQALKPEKALVTAPSFSEYEAAIRISGGETVYEELKEENAFDLTEEIIEQIMPEIRLLFLCNPNNPTGRTISRELLLRIAKRCEETETFFCLDECFLPFMDTEEEYTMRHHLSGFPHLMILKAYTKIFGMAGIRFGYLLSSDTEVLEKIIGMIQPWNVSVPAQAAAQAALSEDAFAADTKKLIRAEREYLLEEMKNLPVSIPGEPAANYIFFKSRPDLAERFLERGVLIRSCENYSGLREGFFRIGIRSPEENRALIRIWKEMEES